MTSTVNHPFFLALRAILKLKVRSILFFKGFRIEGRHCLPRHREPCILIANHAAFIDSVYIICSVRPRFTICGAKPKYFKTSLRRFIFRTANILKIESHEQFLHDCGKLLKSREILLIYPEMGRNPEGMGEFKTWAAEVAIAQQVPVIPCYLYGTTQGHTGPKKLIVGEAITPLGNAEELTEVFHETILGLKPENGEGYNR